MSAPNLAEEPIDGPAIVELMGHRQVAGVWRAVQVAGVGMLRVEVPATDGVPASSHLYHPGAVYGIHPCDEATLAAWVRRLTHQPFARLAIAKKPEDADDSGDGEKYCAVTMYPAGEDPQPCGWEIPCPRHGNDDAD